MQVTDVAKKKKQPKDEQKRREKKRGIFLVGSLRRFTRRHVLTSVRERQKEMEWGHLVNLSNSLPPGARGLIHSHGGALRLRQDKIRHGCVCQQLFQAELSMLGDSRRLPWSITFTSYSERSPWITTQLLLRSRLKDEETPAHCLHLLSKDVFIVAYNVSVTDLLYISCCDHSKQD